MAIEQIEGCARCSAKTIDGLVGISDGKNIALRSQRGEQEFHLGEVGVLKLVDKNETWHGTCCVASAISSLVQQAVRA